MKQLICLDLDGTLEDSRCDMAAVVRRIRAQLGLPVRTDDAILPWVNKGMDQLYRACFDDYIDGGSRIDEVRRRYEADYLNNVAVETRLYPGIADAVEGLAELGVLACVTNKPERISWRLLEELGISQHFTTVVGGDSCPGAKPDPIVLESAARRCGFKRPSSQTVMIGDSPADITMGRVFGATTIWCAWGYASEPGETPDMTAHVPADLPKLIAAAMQT